MKKPKKTTKRIRAAKTSGSDGLGMQNQMALWRRRRRDVKGN